MGGWRSGSAAPLHGDGRGFESLIAHQPSFGVKSHGNDDGNGYRSLKKIKKP